MPALPYCTHIPIEVAGRVSSSSSLAMPPSRRFVGAAGPGHVAAPASRPSLRTGGEVGCEVEVVGGSALVQMVLHIRGDSSWRGRDTQHYRPPQKSSSGSPLGGKKGPKASRTQMV